jgi:hypothetical protein
MNGSEIWIVSALISITVPDTHAGGCEIYIRPGCKMPDLSGYYMQGLETPLTVSSIQGDSSSLQT